MTGRRAPAKLTLSLRITGVRADGMHLIDAEMVSLDLADELLIDESGSGLAATGPFAADLPLDQRNLVAKALRLAERDAHVTINKLVPHGGGLGGGSSDAAAVLRWAGWTGTPDELARAATIGADVAFCLVGGRATVRGIGEIVVELPHKPLTVTLVIPPLHVSTPAVYRRWDELGGPVGPGVNDLESAAVSVEPALATWRERIGAACGHTPVLAGSGATWFVPGEHASTLEPLAAHGATVRVCHGDPGLERPSIGAG